jgi:hypothetical protein
MILYCKYCKTERDFPPESEFLKSLEEIEKIHGKMSGIMTNTDYLCTHCKASYEYEYDS